MKQPIPGMLPYEVRQRIASRREGRNEGAGARLPRQSADASRPKFASQVRSGVHVHASTGQEFGGLAPGRFRPERSRRFGLRLDAATL